MHCLFLGSFLALFRSPPLKNVLLFLCGLFFFPGIGLFFYSNLESECEDRDDFEIHFRRKTLTLYDIPTLTSY